MYKVSNAKDLVSGKMFELKESKLSVTVNGSKYLILQIK